MLEYELWTRLHARRLAVSRGDAARDLLERLARNLGARPRARPMARPLRTFDALHLASFAFLVDRGQPIRLASYDVRQVECATALGFDVVDL